ncbi:MAG: hypothetical protein SFW67_20455 [Myxococcaceae bacterium]|nr:hypothetical protein [Myxococcaceae bacterium]
MPRIGKPAPKTTNRTSTPKAAEKASTAKATTKTSGTKASDKIEFPRANWKDPVKLNDTINRAKDRLGLNEHPRGRYTKPEGSTPRPPVVARYGVIRPPVDGGDTRPPRPPVVARYGVIRPPVIDDGSTPPRPPVVARYGVIRPPVDTDPPRPPVVARYGVIRPRPAVETEPRPSTGRTRRGSVE